MREGGKPVPGASTREGPPIDEQGRKLEWGGVRCGPDPRIPSEAIECSVEKGKGNGASRGGKVIK